MPKKPVQKKQPYTLNIRMKASLYRWIASKAKKLPGIQKGNKSEAAREMLQSLKDASRTARKRRS